MFVGKTRDPSLEWYQGSLTEGERLSTVDLLVLTSLNQLIFNLQILFSFFYKTSFHNEANGTESPSVSIP